MNASGPEFFSLYGSDVAMEVAGKEVLEENGHIIHQKVWAIGDYSNQGGNVLQGNRGTETFFDAYNISPFHNKNGPPMWVNPISVQDTDNNRIMWLRGHLPLPGEHITSEKGDQTVVYQRKVKSRNGPYYENITSGQII